MSDDLDPGLRRLFAATAEHPADEAFVAAVTARTAGRRRSGLLGRALASGAIVGVLAAGLGFALKPVVGVMGALVAASPFGPIVALALVLAGFVCVRALEPLAGLTRL
jgi:hypothetical protein